MIDLLVVATLILVGGSFAASEIALITVKRHRLAQLADDGNRAARTPTADEDPSASSPRSTIGSVLGSSRRNGSGPFSRTSCPVRADPLTFGPAETSASWSYARHRVSDHRRRAGEDAGPQLPEASALRGAPRLPQGLLSRSVARPRVSESRPPVGEPRSAGGYLSPRSSRSREDRSSAGDMRRRRREIQGSRAGDKDVQEVMARASASGGQRDERRRGARHDRRPDIAPGLTELENIIGSCTPGLCQLRATGRSREIDWSSCGPGLRARVEAGRRPAHRCRRKAPLAIVVDEYAAIRHRDHG